MITVTFPPPQFRIRKKGERQYIFDALRKTWLALTEEEWVRQNLLAYFVNVLLYPKEAIALEKAIWVNGLKKRFDILVYNGRHEPWLLVECKAPAVRLSEDVLQQALRYNLSVPVSYLVISNGAQTVAWKKEGDTLVLQTGLPNW